MRRRYENGLGGEVEVESEAVFPLLKSSDLAQPESAEVADRAAPDADHIAG